MALLHRDAARVTAAAYEVVEDAGHGRLMSGAEEAWNGVPSIDWGPVRWRTTFRAVRSAEALIVRFDCRDERPWHTMLRRDDQLWEEEVVEIFIDPAARGEDYAEVEISPANVVCDLRIHEPSPRLRGDSRWDLEGLDTLVLPWAAEGSGPDGWTALAKLPWTGFRSLSPASADRVPPRPGDRWRFNVFRIKRPNGPAEPERDAVYAAWSVPDGPSFHDPAAFKDLVFV